METQPISQTSALRLLDKDWRLNNLYKIKDKNEKRIVFRRNRAQKHFAENRAHRNIILKSRQLGFTTAACIDMLDSTLWRPDFASILIAQTDMDSREIFDTKVDYAFKNYEDRFKEMLFVDSDSANKLKFEFGNGSSSHIIVKSSGRSGTFNHLHISEFAKICRKYPQKAQEILTGSLPAVPLDGRVDIESTAEGEFGEFHDMFWDAWNRGEPQHPTQFKAHFYNWTWDDEELAKATIIAFDDMEKGEYFKEYMHRYNLSEREISYYYLKWIGLNKDFELLQQEYPTTPEEAFVSSGHKLIASDAIQLHMDNVREGKRVGDWVYYEEYNKKHYYGLGADVSEGIGRDSCTIVIWDFFYDKPRVVAEYASDRIAPDLFAHEIARGGEKYGKCIVAPERNNHGMATITKLKELYPINRIYSVTRMDEKLKTETVKLGWATTAATKPKMMYDLARVVENHEVDIPSRRLLNECRTYDKDDLNSVRTDADQTDHWDLLIAAAIGWQMKAHAKPKVVATTKSLSSL